MKGLADAVVVVEAREEGGAVHTAKCARAERRPVVALRWPADLSSSGNTQLLSEGALGVPVDGDIVGFFGGIVGG